MQKNDTIKLIECPRDAMQGIVRFIPSEKKIAYLNQLLKVGFDTLDFGSFVSPKAIPQMRDTAEIISRLDFSSSPTKPLAIIANERGAKEAAAFDEISYLGFPFSISETFQQRNTNSSISQSFERVKNIRDIGLAADKELVVYISMGFGNPYGDTWDINLVVEWVQKLVNEGLQIISLADTVGLANPKSIATLFSRLTSAFPEIEFGAHLHTHPHNWKEKVDAAYQNGCKRFDGALKGYGGCPMAKDELVGNMPTENMLAYFNDLGLDTGLILDEMDEAVRMANELFVEYSKNE